LFVVSFVVVIGTSGALVVFYDCTQRPVRSGFLQNTHDPKGLLAIVYGLALYVHTKTLCPLLGLVD
jgi:hypothetical protein